MRVLHHTMRVLFHTANQTADEDTAFDADMAVLPTRSDPAPDIVTELISFKEGVEGVDYQKKCEEIFKGEFLADVMMCRTKRNRAQRFSTEDQDEAKEDPNVADVEEDQMLYPMRMPDDEKFSRQWGLEEIDAPQAWDMHIGEGRSDIVVAVIDTGVDYNHPDLKDQMWVDPDKKDKHGFDFNGNDNDPMDDDGHGTHCAGVIAASSNNNKGVAGMIWKGVKIMALRFLGPKGGFISDQVRSIEYAIKRGVTISSNSYGRGGGVESRAMRKILQFAKEKNNHKFFVAAGNDGRDNEKTPTWPCNMAKEMEDTVICVASTGTKGRSSFSNFGKNSVNIACPGSNIMSTYPGNRYESLSGTSMATPMCAGLFTLAVSYNPAEKLDVIRKKMMETVDKTRELRGQVKSGGQANALKLLQKVGPGDGTTTERPKAVKSAMKCHTTHQFCLGYEGDKVYCYGYGNGCKWGQKDCTSDSQCAKKYTPDSDKYTDGDAVPCPGGRRRNWRSDACITSDLFANTGRKEIRAAHTATKIIQPGGAI